MTIIEHSPEIEDVERASDMPDVSPRDHVPDGCKPGQTVMTVTESDTDLWGQAERLVYRVYRSVGFCEHSDRGWVEEFEPYRAGSAFHVVVENGRVIGAIRTIIGPISDLPVGQLPIHSVSPSLVVCEVGSLAVEQEFRGLGVTNAVHRQGVQYGFLHGTPAFALAVEPWFIDAYRDLYGLPIQLISEPSHYMGSDTIGGLVYFDELVNVLLRERPKTLNWIFEGIKPELWLPETIDLTDGLSTVRHGAAR